MNDLNIELVDITALPTADIFVVEAFCNKLISALISKCKQDLNKRLFRVPVTENSSVVITVSDTTDVISKGVAEHVILDITLKFQIEYANTNITESNPPLRTMFSVAPIETEEQLLNVIHNLPIVNYQGFNVGTGFAYTVPGIVVKGEIPMLTFTCSAQNIKSVNLQKFVEGAKTAKTTTALKDSASAALGTARSIFNLNVGIMISSFHSKFMK
jgi:flagellar biogenesis protein FliO